MVEKIESFIDRIAQRAIADMVRMHHESELANMWFSVDIGEQRQAKCNEVCPNTCSTNIHFQFFSCSSLLRLAVL